MSTPIAFRLRRFFLATFATSLLVTIARADSNTVSSISGSRPTVHYFTNDVGEVSSNFTGSAEFAPEDLLAVPAGDGGSCGTVYGAASSGVSFGDVVAGQVYTYLAAGSCGYNTSGCASDPDGNITAGACSSQTNAPGGFTCPGLQCWSLVGKIAGGACFQLGSSGTFTASASGELVLYFNDDEYDDNSGAYAVCITTVPELCAGLPANLSTGVSLGNVVQGVTYSYLASGSAGYNDSGCESDPDGNITAGACSSQTNAPGTFTCPGLQCWSLVGKINGGGCFQLGTSGTFTAPNSGTLTVFFNDDDYSDNSGSWAVCITPNFIEWNGPFASWDNIKIKYGATGNGSTDDTAAIANACTNIGIGTNSPVVYFPNGTYLVSQSLITTSMISGVRFVGQDPARTIIKATGGLLTASGAILTIDRATLSGMERITFDGSGNTNLVLISQSMASSNFFDTGDQYVDCVFTNTGFGLITGGDGYGGSEVSVLRDKFYGCEIAGLMTGNFNALDNWVQDCEIGFCTDGLTDHNDIHNGAGGFHAYQCLFHDNTHDIDIGNTSFFSFRDNISTNSGQFMYCYGLMAPAQITLQRNTIVDPKTITCINDGNEGQLALIDNTFLTGSGTAVYHEDSGCESFSISNRYLFSNAASLDCQTIALDDQVISRPANSGTITLSATATNLERFVTNLWAGATGTDIQNAIYAVTNRVGQHPVVHLPWGTNNVTSTIVIPGGVDVQLEGDSLARSILNWTSSSTGTVIQVGSSNAPATATLRNFGIEDGGRVTTGIVAYISNGTLWSRRMLLNNSTDPNGANLLVRNCTNATIDLLDFQFGGSSNGMVVDNSSAVIRIRGCATGPSSRVMILTNRSNVCIDEMWYEGNNAADFLDASGSGTFTVSGFNANVNVGVGPDGQAVLFTNWTGTALMQNGGIRDKVVPASGSGSLWLNGLTYFGITNPLSTPVGLATFNANNLSVLTNAVIESQNDAIYLQTSDFALWNTNLVHSSLSQLRTTKALQNPTAGSMIIESIIVDKSNVGLFVR